MRWGLFRLACFDQRIDGVIAKPLCWIIAQRFQERLADQLYGLFFFLSNFLVSLGGIVGFTIPFQRLLNSQGLFGAQVSVDDLEVGIILLVEFFKALRRYSAALCFRVGQVFGQSIRQSCADPRELVIVQGIDHHQHLQFLLAQAAIDDQVTHLFTWKRISAPKSIKDALRNCFFVL